MFFRQMAPSKSIAETAHVVAELITDAFFVKGATLYRQGDAPQYLYFVVSGTVRLEVEGSRPWELGERSVVGVLDASIDRPHARTAVCTTDVHALRLAVDDWNDVMEDNFELMRGILANSLGMLRGLIASLAPSGGFPLLAEPLAALPAVGVNLESPALRSVERIIVLRDVAAFRRAGIQVIARLAEHVTELRLAAEDIRPLTQRQGDRDRRRRCRRADVGRAADRRPLSAADDHRRGGDVRRRPERRGIDPSDPRADAIDLVHPSDRGSLRRHGGSSRALARAPRFRRGGARATDGPRQEGFNLQQQRRDLR